MDEIISGYGSDGNWNIFCSVCPLMNHDSHLSQSPSDTVPAIWNIFNNIILPELYQNQFYYFASNDWQDTGHIINAREEMSEAVMKGNQLTWNKIIVEAEGSYQI